MAEFATIFIVDLIVLLARSDMVAPSSTEFSLRVCDVLLVVELVLMWRSLTILTVAESASSSTTTYPSSARRKTATYREEPLAMDKSKKKKDDSTRFSTLSPETMAVGPERPRESLEEKGGGVKTRIAQMSIHGRNREEP